jgi:sugar phosphate isomerase/epimerase
LGRLGFADVKGRGDFDYLAEFAGKHGFGLIQISCDNPRYFPEMMSREKRIEIGHKFKALGIGLCFHGPSDIPLLNRHEQVRNAGLERLGEFLEMAIDLGGEYFIIHPGRLGFYSLSSKQVFFMEQRYPERVGATFIDSIGRLLDRSLDKIKLCIENTHTVSPPFLKIVGKLAVEKGLGLVWDVGHMEQLSESAKQRMIEFFQNHLKHICLAHLHGFKAGALHKELGSGEINIDGYIRIFKALSLDIILEIFPEHELLQSLEYVRKYENGAGEKIP